MSFHKFEEKTERLIGEIKAKKSLKHHSEITSLQKFLMNYELSPATQFKILYDAVRRLWVHNANPFSEWKQAEVEAYYSWLENNYELKPSSKNRINPLLRIVLFQASERYSGIFY